MRTEIRSMIGHTEPISEHEIGFTVEYCKAFATSHWQHTHMPFRGADVEDHETVEALSDTNFRTAFQIQYIFQLGLWRMVAVLDAILGQWFPQFARKRLQSRLDAVAEMAEVPAGDLADLKDWIRLRNAFSHSPADAPGLEHQLTRRDLEELAALIRQVLIRLKPFASKAGVA